MVTNLGAGSTALPHITSETLKIHLAGKRDRGSVCRLECACFGWSRLLFGLWQRVGHAGTVSWIADVNGKSIGYLISYTRELDHRMCWYVGGVGVVKSYRRFGIGTQLMSAVMTDHHSLWLHVRASNRAAYILYDRLGMQVKRRLHHFYSNGEDAIVMATPDIT